MKKNITETIKTYEDALKATGRPVVPDLSNFPEDLRTYFENQYKAVVITEALNEGWKADWSDRSQEKYIPWFFVSPSGFSFYDTLCRYSYPYAGIASRLCFKTRALAAYAGEQFLEVYKNITLK